MAKTRSRSRGVRLVRRMRNGKTGWVARWTDPRSKKVKEKDLSDMESAADRRSWCADRARRLRLEKAASGVEAHQDASIETLLDESLQAKRARRLADKTLSGYDASSGLFLGWAREAGVTRGSRLSKAALVRFAEWLAARRRQVPVDFKLIEDDAGGKVRKVGAYRESDEPLAAGSVNRHLREVRALLVELARRDRVNLSRDAISDALRPVQADRVRPRVLSPEEVQKVLKGALSDSNEDGARYAAALLLGTFRPDEALRLQAESVDRKGSTVRVTSGSSRTRRERLVDCTVSPTLPAILLARGRRGPCFPQMTEDARKTLLDRIRRRTGVKFTWRALRSSSASYLACAPGIRLPIADYVARAGHTVETARRRYWGEIRVSPAATTLEDAYGCRDLFEEIAASKQGRLLDLGTAS